MILLIVLIGSLILGAVVAELITSFLRKHGIGGFGDGSRSSD